MKNWKKIVALSLALSMLSSFVGCEGKSGDEKSGVSDSPVEADTEVLETIAFDVMSETSDDSEIPVEGRAFSWDTQGNKYKFSSTNGNSTVSADTYGKFSIVGDLSKTESRNGFDSYFVGENDVAFKYVYDDELISDNDAGDVDWHITEDNQKQIDSISLDSKIKSGAIIIQSSLDGINWYNDSVNTDVFGKITKQSEPIFTTNAIQLLNGTYYRFIVAYKMRKLSGTKGVGVIKTSSYDYFESVEVYSFYLESEQSYRYTATHTNRTNLGELVNAGSKNGFKGKDSITSKDPHYGWQLGHFFVSGYTDSILDNTTGTYTFLKTTGNKVELSFSLEQDLNCLNGNPKLVINDDKDGTDEYFQTDRNVKFHRGALIIRHTNYENVPGTPQIYTDFLAANTRPGADTRISLFEEGDYEVALDYEICNKEGVNSYKNYRIYFKFSIRNGNTMVFPFDTVTCSELSSLSTTPNGFFLDFAKSRYLKINVKRFTLNANGDGLDVRSNAPAADHAAYTDEGIYLIYATNQYTSERTRKIICVGNNTALNEYFNSKVVSDPTILAEA